MDFRSKKQRKRMGVKDKISSLPMGVLARILSFLPLEEAARTSVLSKKWKVAWRWGMKPRWQNPPLFLVEQVLSKLDLRTDIPLFRGVCSSWRTSVSDVTLPPQHFESPRLEFKILNDSYYMVQDYYCLLTSPRVQPWLVRIKETSRNRWRLLNVAKNGHEKLLITDPRVTASINRLKTKFEVLTSTWTVYNIKGDKISKKVVGGWKVGGQFIFAALIQYEESKNGLTLLRMDKKGRIYTENIFDDDPKCNVVDIAFYENSFYAFEVKAWRIGIMDPYQSQAEVIYKPGPSIPRKTYNTMSFVGVNNVLVLVVEKEDRRLYFRYRNFRFFVLREKWEEVPSLENTAIFLGSFVSFSIASDKVGWKSSILCFMGNAGPHPTEFGAYTHIVGNDLEVNFANYPISLSIYKPAKWHKGLRRLMSLSNQKYVRLFFPPPRWVRWLTTDTGDSKELYRLSYRLTGKHSCDYLMIELDDV